MAASRDRVVKVRRWRINDNLPGTREFCPIVFRTERVARAAGLDVPRLFGALTDEFGEDLLMRAAVWMTLRESKASYTIEGEADRVGRVQRFADVMARRTGQGEVPLSDSALAELQREILGDRTTIVHFGVRQSPAFVGKWRATRKSCITLLPQLRRSAPCSKGCGCSLNERGASRP